MPYSKIGNTPFTMTWSKTGTANPTVTIAPKEKLSTDIYGMGASDATSNTFTGIQTLKLTNLDEIKRQTDCGLNQTGPAGIWFQRDTGAAVGIQSNSVPFKVQKGTTITGSSTAACQAPDVIDAWVQGNADDLKNTSTWNAAPCSKEQGQVTVEKFRMTSTDTTKVDAATAALTKCQAAATAAADAKAAADAAEAAAKLKKGGNILLSSVATVAVAMLATAF